MSFSHPMYRRCSLFQLRYSRHMPSDGWIPTLNRYSTRAACRFSLRNSQFGAWDIACSWNRIPSTSVFSLWQCVVLAMARASSESENTFSKCSSPWNTSPATNRPSFCLFIMLMSNLVLSSSSSTYFFKGSEFAYSYSRRIVSSSYSGKSKSGGIIPLFFSHEENA
jgi:hypothetical protein